MAGLSPKSPRSSRPSTPSKPSYHIYHPNHSRSKSQLPPPRVLPFPDLPVKAISSESPFVPSPLSSPVPTRRSSSTTTQDANYLHVEAPSMLTTVSSDSADDKTRTPFSGNSPLTLPSIPSGPPSVAMNTPGPSRTRASTNLQQTPLRPIYVPPSTTTGTPTRTQGFDPIPLSPSSLSIPVPTTRPSSLPTPSSVTHPTHPPASTPSHETNRLPQPTKKLSSPPPTPSIHLKMTPNPPTHVLTDHMHQSFIKGTCADVRLWVRKWGVGWLVHRMVLVQAGMLPSQPVSK